MIFSDEVCNVTEPNDGRAGSPVMGRMTAMPRDRERPAPDEMILQSNAAAFAAIINLLGNSPGGGIIYFPPGRYYLGRSSGNGGFIVPSKIALRFAPLATLVPYRYPDGFKVNVVIEGSIDAGIHPIFDVTLQSVHDSRIWTRPASELIEAGTITLRGDKVRQVYPEWWGAVVPEGLRGPITSAVARHTTMALQETIEAAHSRRPFFQNSNPIALTGDKSIPIVLTGDYTIDSELTIGVRWWDSESGARPVPVNGQGFIMKGIRAPRPDGTGTPTIRAHAPFSNDGMNPGQGLVSRLTPESAALLGVRGVRGWKIQDIGFDAGYSAPRCVTVEAPNEAQQQPALEGCSFRNALRELLHYGAEVLNLTPVASSPGTFVSDTLGNLHWSTGGMDVLHPRIFRCSFDTGSVERLRQGMGSGGMAVRPPVGVVYRTAQTILMELQNCAFKGPASPMFHAFAGRASFKSCSFDTIAFPGVPKRRPTGMVVDLGGLDIMLDQAAMERMISPGESLTPIQPARVPLPVCTLKDVVSRSPKLLWTVTAVWNGRPPPGSAQLINVDHDPRLTSGASLEPAIVWGTVGESFSRLVLSACRFKRPTTAGGFAPPIALAFGLWVLRPQQQADQLSAYETPNTSAGHIIDLGTRVDGDTFVPLVSTVLMEMHAGTFSGMSMDFIGRAIRVPLVQRVRVRLGM